MATFSTEEFVQPGLMPMRIYRPGRTAPIAPVVLHLHGGAFIDGSLEGGETVAALLADCGATVFSADYPLAPAHVFPDAIEAAYRALEWLHRNKTRSGKKAGLFVAGEEAGGNLAAGLALMARDQQTPPLAGQILLSPMLDPCLATCSMREAEAGPVGCRWADGWHQYLGSAEKAAHPYAAPSGASRLAGVAPALVLAAEDDLLRDESVNYARRLRAAGVTVHKHVFAKPTGWPEALSRKAGGSENWIGPLRDRFAEFFAATLGVSRAVHPSSHSLEALKE